jgi:hypothetical protein
MQTTLYCSETDTLLIVLDAALPQAIPVSPGAFDDRIQLLWAAPDSNSVLGCRIIGAKDLGAKAWARHLDRPLLPLAILRAVDGWYDTLEPPDSLLSAGGPV